MRGGGQVDLGIAAADDSAKAVILGLTKIGGSGLMAGGCGAALAGGGRGGDPVHGHGAVGGGKGGGEGGRLVVLVWGAVEGVLVSGGDAIDRVGLARVGAADSGSGSRSNGSGSSSSSSSAGSVVDGAVRVEAEMGQGGALGGRVERGGRKAAEVLLRLGKAGALVAGVIARVGRPAVEGAGYAGHCGVGGWSAVGAKLLARRGEGVLGAMCLF
jgi:hypothetical protein